MSNALRIERKEITELFVIYLYWGFVSLLTLKTQGGFTEYALLFILPPLVYLLTQMQHYMLRILLQAGIVSVLFVFGIDILAHITGAWVIKGSIGYTIYASTIVDNFIWALLYSSLVLSWYKYFFDRYKSYKIDKRLQKYFLFFLATNIAFVATWLISFLLIAPAESFFYATLMAPMVFFTFSTFYFYPHLTKKIFLAGATLFPASLLYEYTSLVLDHWHFENGTFLLLIPFAGKNVPIEEFFWFFFAVTFFVCINELIVDNKK